MQHSESVTHDRLVQRIQRAWDAFTKSSDGLTDEQIMTPGVTGPWSVRDIIAHVTWWEEEALKHLPVILAGGVPPRYSVMYGGIDAFNALMTNRRQPLSLMEVLRHRDEVHRRLVEFVRGVPIDQIAGDTRFRRRLRLDTYGHYPKHTKAILGWRAGYSSRNATTGSMRVARRAGM
jgi:DinB superfamily